MFAYPFLLGAFERLRAFLVFVGEGDIGCRLSGHVFDQRIAAVSQQDLDAFQVAVFRRVVQRRAAVFVAGTTGAWQKKGDNEGGKGLEGWKKGERVTSEWRPMEGVGGKERVRIGMKESRESGVEKGVEKG